MMTGILIGLLAAFAVAGAVAAFGSQRWTACSRKLRSRLQAACMPMHPRMVDFREIEGLPPPVQTYFQAALREGQPMVIGVRVQHRGTFNMGDTMEQWRPFKSEQRVVTRRPGFDWDARIRMLPGLAVNVHDAYVTGEGILHAALLGLFPVADLRESRGIAEGELMCFLAEAAWYPTALLPSQGISWEAVEKRSSRSTLTDGSITLTMLFTFDPEGMIGTVRAEARGRTVGKEILPTPWQGRFWNYAERGGTRVPPDGEVSWLLPGGEKSYWRGRIAGIEYEFAE